MSVQTIFFTGVDISKDSLAAAYRVGGQWRGAEVPNDVDSIRQWASGFDLGSQHFVLEATGPYSERAVHALWELGARFSVVNPAQSRAMSKALMRPNKTDGQDAMTLCQLGEKLRPNLYRMPTAQQKKRKEAMSALASLQKQEQQLNNQLHAFSYLVGPNPVAVEALRSVLASVQAAVRQLEQELALPDGDEEADRAAALICSVKCVGTKTAQAVTALFGGLGQFHSTKAFAQFLGLAPTEFRSGSSVRGKNSISKHGNAKLRALLFNCARSAIRHNPQCKELYDRLIAKGKNGSVAFTAVMHKIARIIFGVVRSGVPYDPKFAI